MSKKRKVFLPQSAPRNPTVAPMMKLTKPGKHKKKDRIPKSNDYFKD